MHTDTALALTILAFAYALVSALVKRWCIAPALIFVASGIALGPYGLELIELDAGTQGFKLLAQLALTVILFNQASTLDLRKVLRRGNLTLRLLVIGIPLTIALGALTAVLLLPVLPFWEAVCLAIIVAPTEIALVDALLDDDRIPEQARHALSVESGLYDGVALAALFAVLAVASEQAAPDPGRWAWFAFRTELVSMLVGAVIGLIGGVVIALSRARAWMNDTWAQLATLALALVSFEVGERLHASGFVAAFASGLAYAMVRSASDDQPAMTQVSDATGRLLELLVFAALGAFAVVPAWRDASWQALAFAILALVFVRVIAVAIALAGSGVPARSTLFIGWFGPRGISTLVLGLLVIERGNLQQGAAIAEVAVLIVTVSLVLHSLTAPVGARRWLATRAARAFAFARRLGPRHRRLAVFHATPVISAKASWKSLAEKSATPSRNSPDRSVDSAS